MILLLTGMVITTMSHGVALRYLEQAILQEKFNLVCIILSLQDGIVMIMKLKQLKFRKT